MKENLKKIDGKTIYLSVIIPAYNEKKRISKTLVAIDHYLARQNFNYEIIVVNDGSSDSTSQIVQKFQDLIKNLTLIDNKINHGKGYVVRQGLLAARGKYRLFTDADNSTSIDHIEKMWNFFENGYEIVIGSRDPKDAVGAKQAIAQPLVKRILGNLGNILIQLLAVPGIWDTQCGFKAFSEKAVKSIFPRTKINRWGFDIEILALAKKMGYKIGIIPVNWLNDPQSKVSWKAYLRTFYDLLKIKWNLITDKYQLKSKN